MAVKRALIDEKATILLGEDLAAAAKPGDIFALFGGLGVGKTTLARAIIRAIACDRLLEVPSPTYTIVQTYDLRIPVIHTDLYRLSSPGDLDEIGLADEGDTSLTLVEWPENAGSRFLGSDVVSVRLEMDGESRRVQIDGPGSVMNRIERSLLARQFLKSAGYGETQRNFLQGDASTRSYERISGAAGEPAILMDSPARTDGPPVRNGMPYSRIAHLAETVVPFVAIGRTLRERGFCAPEIHAADLDNGFLAIEDLGTGDFLAYPSQPVGERYAAAATLLADFHRERWPREIVVDERHRHAVPAYDRQAMMIEAELLTDWYLPHAVGRTPDASILERFRSTWHHALDLLENCENSLVLRDYHSPNIIWRGERQGRDRIGLIDFQDAVFGPTAYDMASLALDARVDISEELEAKTVEAYCTGREAAGSFSREDFKRAYSIMAAQRNSKILGIFIRLDRRDGKSGQASAAHSQLPFACPAP
jgi:tRNA threonylcarbamoyl adenosine modification protein YjeE